MYIVFMLFKYIYIYVSQQFLIIYDRYKNISK